MLSNNTEVCLGSPWGVSGLLVSLMPNYNSNNWEIAWLVRQDLHCLWFIRNGLRQKEIDPLYLLKDFWSDPVFINQIRLWHTFLCWEKRQQEPKCNTLGRKEQLMMPSSGHNCMLMFNDTFKWNVASCKYLFAYLCTLSCIYLFTLSLFYCFPQKISVSSNIFYFLCWRPLWYRENIKVCFSILKFINT